MSNPMPSSTMSNSQVVAKSSQDNLKEFLSIFLFSNIKVLSDNLNKDIKEKYKDYITYETEGLRQTCRLNLKGKIIKSFFDNGLEVGILTYMKESYQMSYKISDVCKNFADVVEKDEVYNMLDKMYDKGLIEKESNIFPIIECKLTRSGRYILENGVIELEK